MVGLHFDLIDLRLFVDISEAKSLTHGAKRSHISLAAASMRIKNLEDAVGAQLLYRASHGVTLTPAGQALLHHAREVLKQLERLRGDLQEYAEGIKGHVRVFCNPNAMTEFLPAALGEFLATHPDVDIELEEHLSHEIVRAVSDGMADIGIAAGSVRTDGLEVLPYRADRLVLVASPTHPLAVKTQISFLESLDADFIGMSPSSAIQEFLNQQVRELGATMKIRIQVASFDAMCRMVEANVGIGVAPESAARRHLKNMDIRLVELSDPWAVCALKIYVREVKALPAFAQELVDHLTNTVSTSQTYSVQGYSEHLEKAAS